MAIQVGLRASDAPLLAYVQEELLKRDEKIPGWGETTPADQQHFRDVTRGILLNQVSNAEISETAQRIADAIAGLGVLSALLREPGVEEIYVRGHRIAILRDGQFEMIGEVADDKYFERLIKTAADETSHSLTRQNPVLLTDLQGGERFTALLPPVVDRPSINIRTFGRRVRTAQDLAQADTFHMHAAGNLGRMEDIRDTKLRAHVAAQADAPLRFLAWLMATLSASVLIGGQFSSGKTTLLNVLSEFFPAGIPLAVLETFRELELAPGTFAMRAVAPSQILPGETERITMAEVLNVAFTRCDPAAILLGEIVSPGEALQFLTAANLGRRAYTTIHGESVPACLHRLEMLTLAAQPGLSLAAVRSLIAAGVNVVVMMDRAPREDGGIARYVSEITWIRGVDSAGEYLLERLYNGTSQRTEALYRAAAAASGLGESA